MAAPGILKRIPIDPYLLMLIGTVLLATFLPVFGLGATILSKITYVAVALLFFLYGAKLKTQAVVAGMANWKLQLLVFASTYVLFPLVGVAISSSLSGWLTPEILMGFMFLAVLPSTVQSSIAFTSMAHGNIPAAVCAASVSNLLGVFITPALAAMLLHASGGGIDAHAIWDIAIQLLLPFAVGQLVRPWIGPWIERHRQLTMVVDRGSILLIVYSAFSAGVVAGIWSQVEPITLVFMVVADLVLLAVMLASSYGIGKAVGLSREDQIVLLFCGSKKSLASGIPMANILFAGQAVGLIVLPLMIFHQLQLFACALIAQRYASSYARERLMTDTATAAAKPA